MKICILSMQRVENMGSLLQCYALKRMIEQLGHEVSFLDIEPDQADNAMLGGKWNRFSNEGEPGESFLSKIRKLDKYTFNRLRIKALDKRQHLEFERFRRDTLGISHDTSNEHFDCCVIGSDEVFNCLSGADWGFTSQLFGNVRQADRVVTYAASCGATVCEDVPEEAVERIREVFGNVSAFSVRDHNTYEFVTKLTEAPVYRHLDPALIWNFSNESGAMQLPKELPDRYCIVYSYYNRICKEQDIAQIKRFCAAHGMEIISVGAPQMWIKKHIVVSPFEMLKVFRNAEFVITDTFHGTIFSAKHTRKFAVMVRESNENKLRDLVQRLGIEDHVVDSMERLENAWLQESDLQQITERTEEEKTRSIQYLQNSLI